MKKLTWLFGCPLLLDDVAQESWLFPGPTDLLLEVGPRHVSQPRVARSLVQSPSAFPDTLPPLPLSFLFLLLWSLGDLFSLHPTPRLESWAHAFPMWEDTFED